MSKPAPKKAVMTPDEILALLREGFVYWDKTGVAIEAVGWKTARLRLAVKPSSLRLGGTVSGPTMFMLADTALYIAVIASVGPKGLAVTTNMSINFMRKPPPADMIAECRLLKLGARLAVGEVTLFSEGDDEPVAHAVGTYALPPS